MMIILNKGSLVSNTFWIVAHIDFICSCLYFCITKKSFSLSVCQIVAESDTVVGYVHIWRSYEKEWMIVIIC